RETFHDDQGNLNIRVVSNDSENIKIDGDKEQTSGGWTRKLFSPLSIEGPIFTTGGLYKFRTEILTVDADSNMLSQRPTVEGAISIAEKTTHPITGGDGKNYDIGITSYYDTTDNFKFDPQNRTISFEMPFDWSEKNVKQTTIIHEEIHIPKTYAELLVTKYDGFVNGVPLAESSVTIDDYSEDSRIVHLVLNQQDLASSVQKSKDSSKMIFTVMPGKTEDLPLKAFTHNAVLQLGLSWEPIPIQTQSKTRFYMDFSKYYAPKIQESVRYDFVIKQDDTEIFRKSLVGTTNAPPQTNYVDFEFSEQNVGTAIISIENIDGNDLSAVDFVVVVKPKSEPKQNFPIRIPSMIKDDTGNTVQGRYNVDLTWIPNTLGVGDAEFIITIYDKASGFPIRQAEYDFVLLKDNNEVYRKSGFAQAGGSFENVRFFEEYVGPLTLRIENIDQSDEFVEIPIMVTPEFPVVFLVLIVALVPLVFASRMLYGSHKY
ncbi:MAG: peptidase, partial [Thermoproteota archaeon]